MTTDTHGKSGFEKWTNEQCMMLEPTWQLARVRRDAHHKAFRFYSRYNTMVSLPPILIGAILSTVSFNPDAVPNGVGTGLAVFVTVMSTINSYFALAKSQEGHRQTYRAFNMLVREIEVNIIRGKEDPKRTFIDFLEYMNEQFTKIIEEAPALNPSSRKYLEKYFCTRPSPFDQILKGDKTASGYDNNIMDAAVLSKPRRVDVNGLSFRMQLENVAVIDSGNNKNRIKSITNSIKSTNNSPLNVRDSYNPAPTTRIPTRSRFRSVMNFFRIGRRSHNDNNQMSDVRIDELDDVVAHTTDIVKNSNIIAMEREREREREKELVREILNEKKLNKKNKRESVKSKFDHLMDENDNDKNRKTDNNKNENKNKNDNENDLLNITRMMSSGSGSSSSAKVNSQDLLSSMSNYKKSNIMQSTHTPSLVDDTDEEQVSLEIDEDMHHTDDENYTDRK